jgi:hypothetical protein
VATTPLPAPRIFGILAARAPVVAVLRRGPSAWSHVGRWDLASGEYTAGSWIRGNLYPQRCDLSPDGRWLCYFTLKGSARWGPGPTYVAISRLPWLTALAAWGTCGTWTRGLHFVARGDHAGVGEPGHGDIRPLRRVLGLAATRPASFQVERRRGWRETSGSPPRAPGDMWDERRAETLTLEKARPGAPGTRLLVRGWFAAFRESSPAKGSARYAIGRGGEERELEGIQWADWAARGRLLVATAEGALQIRGGPRADDILSEVDLRALSPDPVAPPDEARRW